MIFVNGFIIIIIINTLVICYIINDSSSSSTCLVLFKTKGDMKRKAQQEQLGNLFLEVQSVYKRAKLMHIDPLAESPDMDVIIQHVEEVRELYMGNQPEFAQDLNYFNTEMKKAPNLFATEKDFWDFFFLLTGRTRYPLLTYHQKIQCCFSCSQTKECMGEPNLKVPLCSSECQEAFYKMFNMYQ